MPLRERLYTAAQWIFFAGILAAGFFFAWREWPGFFDFIPPHALSRFIILALVLMFVSGPLLIYSAVVGISRMRDMSSAAERYFGGAFGVVLLIAGMTNLGVPVRLAFRFLAS